MLHPYSQTPCVAGVTNSTINALQIHVHGLEAWCLTIFGTTQGMCLFVKRLKVHQSTPIYA